MWHEEETELPRPLQRSGEPYDGDCCQECMTILPSPCIIIAEKGNPQEYAFCDVGCLKRWSHRQNQKEEADAR